PAEKEVRCAAPEEGRAVLGHEGPSVAADLAFPVGRLVIEVAAGGGSVHRFSAAAGNDQGQAADREDVAHRGPGRGWIRWATCEERAAATCCPVGTAPTSSPEVGAAPTSG